MTDTHAVILIGLVVAVCLILGVVIGSSGK